MPRPPYINFPFPFYRNYPRKPLNYQNIPNISENSFQSAQNNTTTNNVSNSNRNEKNKSNKYTNDYLFDLFGLKIYDDDVLLVSLIYFLYSEGVKDDSLFIALILLLLS